MTPTTKRGYAVVANGTKSVPMTKRDVEKIARWLREGKTGRRGGVSTKVAAEVVAA